MRKGLIPALLVSALLMAVSLVWADDDQTHYYKTVVISDDSDNTAFIGIIPGEVTSDIASDYGVKTGEGILVEGVVPETPAAEVGLRENDVITRINDAVITGPAELRIQLKKYKPGDVVNIMYLRGGQQKVVAVKLAERSDPEIKVWSGDLPKGKLRMDGPPWEWSWQEKSGKKHKVAFAGIVTQSLSTGLAEYFKVKDGALISEVVKDSPAERAGLKAGDVIIKIGNETIEDEGDVGPAIREHKPDDVVDFVIRREGVEMTIKVTLGETTKFGSLDLKDLNIDIENDIMRIKLDASKEIENLAKELERLQIEMDVETMQDIQIPEPPAVPAVPGVNRIDGTSAVTISYAPGLAGAWRYHWQQFRTRMNETFTRLRFQLEQVNQKLRIMAHKLNQAMA